MHNYENPLLMNEEELLTPKIQWSINFETRMEDVWNRYFFHEKIKQSA